MIASVGITPLALNSSTFAFDASVRLFATALPLSNSAIINSFLQKCQSVYWAYSLLPQPFVTAAQTQNDKIRVALDLNQLWEELGDGSALITGCVIARKEAVEANPGAIDLFLDQYAASVDYVNANVDEAATMIHGMLANNFTSGVVHLAEGADVAAFTAAVHEAIKTNPWMCGFPEKELIADLGGNYVLIAFGVNDAMNPFQTHFVEAYPSAQIVYNDNLA